MRTTLIKVIKLYASALTAFSIFRVLLFFTEMDRVGLAEDGISNILRSFIMGVRFDLVISGYILFFPVLALLIADILNIKSRRLNSVVQLFISLLFSIAFFICAADIPYFNQFFARFSITAFEWMSSPMLIFKMIAQEPLYSLFSIPAIVLMIVFYRVSKKIIDQSSTSEKVKWFIKIPVYILVLGVMFLGIRGRISKKSPIRIGTAYFCNNAFLNQLGLNPVFTLMKSALESKDERNKRIKLMDSELAKVKVRSTLGMGENKYSSPIARDVTFDTLPQNKPNVVIILMESMSAAKMKRHGNKQNLTPFLDSLSDQSIYFENFYTDGKHTYNGIFATLFSYPTIFRQHPMKQIRRYNGISETLKKHDYHSIYFTTHDGQFDNIEGFLMGNGFDQVISQNDYPYQEVKTALGVPDDYMLSYSIPILNKLAEKDQPFLSVFMTASDHGPYYIPEYFTPKAEDIKDQIVQYADWSLKQFVEASSKQSWFNNTIFVFLADHGAAVRTDYDIPLDFHHSPLIFYAPGLLDSTYSVNKIGGQIDVFPSILGLLELPYVNNTFGVDLFSDERKYVVVNDDDKIGVMDNEFFLIIRTGEDSKLYKYRNRDKKDYASSYKDKVKELENYVKSILQVNQDMITSNETYIE